MRKDKEHKKLKRTKIGGAPEHIVRPTSRPIPKNPYIKINLKKVTEYARTMCTDQELAAALGLSYAQFKQRKKSPEGIQEAIDEGRSQGCYSLRAAQMKSALSGNTHMMKWCGMQYLGQKHNMSHANDPVNPMPAPFTQIIANITTAEEAMAARDAYMRKSREKKGK